MTSNIEPTAGTYPATSFETPAEADYIRPEELARIQASVYEPNLDWDNPDVYDLLDRSELTSGAMDLLIALEKSGYTIVKLTPTAADDAGEELVNGEPYGPTPMTT